MKIRIGLAKQDWKKIAAKLEELPNGHLIRERNKKFRSPGEIREEWLADLIIKAIQNFTADSLADFLAFLHAEKFALVDQASIDQIKKREFLDSAPYQLAQAVFFTESSFEYINFSAFAALSRKNSTFNLLIIQARIALKKKKLITAKKRIKDLDSNLSEDLAPCIKVILAYNINRLKQELKEAKCSKRKLKSFTVALEEILKQQPFYAYPQLISVAYQLNQYNDYFYFRFGGILAQERSWLALLISGVISAASLTGLIALLAISHGTATPVLFVLGQFLLSVMQPHTLLVLTATLAGISLFSFIGETIAPSFNQLFFRNLYYFPVSLSQYLYQQGNNSFTKYIYGFLGLVAGILYHPLFSIVFFLESLRIKVLDSIEAAVFFPFMVAINISTYTYNKVAQLWQKEVTSSRELEQQSLTESPAAQLQRVEETVPAVSPALGNIATIVVDSDLDSKSPTALPVEGHIHNNLFTSPGSKNKTEARGFRCLLFNAC